MFLLSCEALFSNIQKITSAENLRSRASDDELNINSYRIATEKLRKLFLKKSFISTCKHDHQSFWGKLL